MKQAEKSAEPPSCLQPPIFMIGRDSSGHWVAQEQSGARGGLFVDRAAALKYAKSKSGNHPRAVVLIGGTLELNAGFAPAISADQRILENSTRQRRVA